MWRFWSVARADEAEALGREHIVAEVEIPGQLRAAEVEPELLEFVFRLREIRLAKVCGVEVDRGAGAGSVTTLSSIGLSSDRTLSKPDGSVRPARIEASLSSLSTSRICVTRTCQSRVRPPIPGPPRRRLDPLIVRRRCSYDSAVIDCYELAHSSRRAAMRDLVDDGGESSDSDSVRVTQILDVLNELKDASIRAGVTLPVRLRQCAVAAPGDRRQRRQRRRTSTRDQLPHRADLASRDSRA